MQGKIKTDRLYYLMTIVVMLILLSCSVKAQDTVVVKGVVYSHVNQPLADVSVSVAGSLELPEVTNEAGEFSVLSTSGDNWLIFSPAADYKVKRIYLNHRQQLRVYMTPLDMVSGDDPVQIMGRPVLRRNIAAAYTAVNIHDITSSAVITVDEFIQGRAAGLNVVRRSGQPGSGAFVTLRGINSLNAGNQPLYVIDGVPVTQTGILGSNILGFAFNPLVELSLFDISAVNVIKDPAVAAAYGSRGSNGLILIETLDPSVTKTVIELDLRTGISLSPARKLPQLDALQHKSLMQEVLYTSGKLEEDIILDYPTLFLEEDDKGFIDYQHNTNWQDEIFRNAIFNNLNINVKGGDEIATYGLSFGLVDNKGTIKDTELNGYNLRFVSRLNVFRWLKMNAGVSINYSKSSMKDAATSQETSPILTALGKSPLLNPYQYDEQGNEISAVSEVDGIGVSNPVAVIEGFDAHNINQIFVYSMGLNADINSRFSIKSKFNLTYNTLKENIFMPNHGMEHYYNNEAWNVAKAASDNLRSFFNNTYLSYNQLLGEGHNLSSMTGFNVQTNDFEFDWQIAKNSHSSDQYRTTADGQANLREIGGQNRKWNWLSVYENLFYSYKDKYLINASISFDGSSRIGKEATNTLKLGRQPFGLFYSAGLAWRLSGESFLKNKTWLEDLKWRLSYGKTGNDDIGESSATNYYTAVKFRETVGLYPAVINNDELTYESVSQLNTGIDITLWGSRVTASLDLFQSKTRNMLIYSPVNTYLGYDYRMENSGKMKNTGFEISGFVRVVETPDLKWDVYLNLSQVKNEVVDIKGSKLITELEGAEIVSMEGSPANSFYGYIFKGVYSSTEDAVSAGLLNDRDMAYGAGDAIYEDLSGPSGEPDGVINQYDKTTIGSPLPDLLAGISTTIYYKRFSFSALVQVVSGKDVFNFVRYKNEQMSGLENQSANVLNRWQYEGQVTDVPRALWNDPIGNSAFSTRWIEDGSYVRLKNLALKYRIPDEFLVFKNAEIYVSVNNLLTLTKYLGYDPEFSYSFFQMHQGIDYGLTPQARQFLIGIKVGL